MAAPRKILAIKLRSLGDTVIMTAPLAEIRAAFPEAEIHALVPDAWSSLLETHPAVDQVLKFKRPTHKLARMRSMAKLALELRKQKYDLVICFHASSSTANLAIATGARLRSVHFHG